MDDVGHPTIAPIPGGACRNTGKRFEFCGVAIGRMRNGKIVETKSYWNLATYLTQLGLTLEQAAPPQPHDLSGRRWNYIDVRSLCLGEGKRRASVSSCLRRLVVTRRSPYVIELSAADRAALKQRARAYTARTIR